MSHSLRRSQRGLPTTASSARPTSLDPRVGQACPERSPAGVPGSPVPPHCCLSSPDVILVGEDDDAPGIRCLHESLDHFIEFSWFGFPGNLDGLGNTDPPWVSEMPKSVIHPPRPPPPMTVAGTESSKGKGAYPQGAPSRLPTINQEPHLTACALSDGISIGPSGLRPPASALAPSSPASREICTKASTPLSP